SARSNTARCRTAARSRPCSPPRLARARRDGASAARAGTTLRRTARGTTRERGRRGAARSCERPRRARPETQDTHELAHRFLGPAHVARRGRAAARDSFATDYRRASPLVATFRQTRVSDTRLKPLSGL